VIVAVAVVRVVEVPGHEVVLVVAVRYCFVTTTRSVAMGLFMLPTSVSRRAGDGISVTDVETMLVDVAFVGMVEVPVVQVIDMAAVTDAGMPTSGGVLVLVALVDVVVHLSSANP